MKSEDKNQGRKKMNILTALDAIVDYAKSSKLSDKYYKKSANCIKVISSIMWPKYLIWLMMAKWNVTSAVFKSKTSLVTTPLMPFFTEMLFQLPRSWPNTMILNVSTRALPTNELVSPFNEQ